jgi:hypothetical protein
MATEAFYAAAGLPKEWPRDMTLLAVHCKIAELMCADPTRARAIRIPVGPVRGFLQAPFWYKWETWLPKTSAPSWDWNPLRGGLCCNEEFESTSTEARSKGSGWLEIIVQGKLGNDNAGKLAVAKQACPTHHFPGCSSNLHRVRTLARINILFAGPLRKRLVVLDIKRLVDLNNMAQNSGPDRSKFM